jgi:preprotein translocase subunit SecG
MHVIAVLWALCALILILVILIQKGRGAGLSGAFGGGGAGGILGTKTGDFLTWVTVTVVGVFILLTIVMAKFYRPIVASANDTPVVQTQPATVPPPVVEGQEVPEATETETDIETDLDGELEMPLEQK